MLLLDRLRKMTSTSKILRRRCETLRESAWRCCEWEVFNTCNIKRCHPRAGFLKNVLTPEHRQLDDKWSGYRAVCVLFSRWEELRHLRSIFALPRRSRPGLNLLRYRRAETDRPESQNSQLCTKSNGFTKL